MLLASFLLAIFAGTTARECTSDIISPVSQVRYERIVSTYSYGCGFLWLGRCRRTRQRTITLLVYQLQNVGTETQCCTGYSTSQSGMCTPICSGHCESPRYCSQPNSCICIDSGYTGIDCDIPVCTPNCRLPQGCVAPNTCQCNAGLTGQNCDEDINECEALEDTGCEQICVNTDRSYTCACQQGYALGADEARCVGSVNISLATVNSSALVAKWTPPAWDSERLTTSYAISCSNGSHSVNTTILNDTSSGGNIQENLVLETGGGYECCIVVNTLNGNGPQSCTVITVPQVQETATTEASTTVSETQSESSTNRTVVTGSHGDSTVLGSSGFKIGVGVAGACVAVVIIVCLMVACYALCQCTRKEKAPIMGSLNQSFLHQNEQHEFDNELYKVNVDRSRVKSIDEEDDSVVYDEIRDNGRINNYEDAPYHYIKY